MELLVNNQQNLLVNKIKQIKIDKHLNLLKDLQLQLTIYQQNKTILTNGLKKEIFLKLAKIARKITRALNDRVAYAKFVGPKNERQVNYQSLEMIQQKYHELLDLLTIYQNKILADEKYLANSVKKNQKIYHQQLLSYTKSNFKLTKQNKEVKLIDRRELFAGYLFTIPALIFISIFVLFSVGYAVWTSFNIVKLHGAGFAWTFVGFDQFVKVAQSAQFQQSLITSLTYMGMVAPIQTVIALVLSSVLASKIRGNKVFLVIYFLPTLTSSTALTMIFVRLAGTGGPLEAILGPNFAKDHILGLISIMNIWSTVPLFITTFNAAHADVPRSQYEAMEIDGAGPIRKFFKVTVPYLRPVTSYVLMMGVIGTLQMFDQAYIIAKDPTIGASTDDLTTTAKYIFDKAFGGNFLANDFGSASAAAIIFTSIILGFSIIASFISKPIGAK